MSTVSVVMVSYHTGSSLWLAIDSVLAQPECSELILVNNGNVPGVEALITARVMKEPRLKLVNGQGNVGFAKGCNLGAKKAKAEYILLLNPDCMLPDGGLARALEGIKSYPQNTVAGCFLANPSGSEQRGGRRGLLTPYNALLESLGLAMMLPPDKKLNLNQTKMPAGVHEVPAISGAFMLMARAYYEKMHGMDEAYFLHMEDMDFCYRVNKSGGKIICLPEVRVIHFRSTSDVSSAFVEKEKAKSFHLYLTKHFKDEASKAATALMGIGIKLRSLIKRFVNAVNGIFEPPLYGKQQVARLVTLYGITRFEKRNATLTGKKVLVTGASGQLGLCLVAEMLARGASVVGVTQYTRIPFEHENLVWVERNLRDKGNPLHGSDADIVLHAAELTYLLRLLPELIESGAKRVIAFSCIPVIEKAASRYKSDKQRAALFQADEKQLLAIAKDKGCDLTIFRPSNMYGAGLDTGLTKQADIINRYGLLPLYAPAKGMRQPIHVRDVADAAMLALENQVTYGKIYAIGGGTEVTYREMIERVFAYLGKKPNFIQIPFTPQLLTVLGTIYSLSHMNGDIAFAMNRSATIDNSIPAQEFGFKARGFLEGDAGF